MYKHLQKMQFPLIIKTKRKKIKRSDYTGTSSYYLDAIIINDFFWSKLYFETIYQFTSLRHFLLRSDSGLHHFVLAAGCWTCEYLQSNGTNSNNVPLRPRCSTYPLRYASLSAAHFSSFTSSSVVLCEQINYDLVVLT